MRNEELELEAQRVGAERAKAEAEWKAKAVVVRDEIERRASAVRLAKLAEAAAGLTDKDRAALREALEAPVVDDDVEG